MTAADLGCIEPTPINKAPHVINGRRNKRAMSESMGARWNSDRSYLTVSCKPQNNMHPLLNELALSLAVPVVFLYCLAVVLAILSAIFDLLMDVLRSRQQRVLSDGLHKETMS